jgi:hypothetical protein
MNMRRLLSLVAFFATLQASAQQVNPVPDYVFSNRMSAGRNTVTDTAAYFSIGPRYGATRGMMPPMVVDTASFSGSKRNGLLIFSVQKNKFLYWDSVGVKWAEMAGTGGTAISSGDTAAMLLPYVRHAGYGLTKSGQSFLVDTLNISTRAWRQKGLDSLAALEVSGSGTTNYIPKFTASTTIGNSQIVDNGASGVNVGVKLTIRDDGPFITGPNISGGANNMAIGTPGSGGFIALYTNNSERLRIFANGRVSVNTITDAGYQLDINGTLRSVNGANFATTSGSVGINTTSPSGKLQINSGSFSVASSTFTGDAIVINSGAVTSALNTYGSGINFTRLGDNGTRSSGISIVQTGSDNDQTGLAFFTHTSNTGSDPMVESARLKDDAEFLINTSTDNGDYKLQVNGNSLFSGNIRTAAPAGGTANDWRLGTVATVSPTSPNRTIEVSIGGTIYYIHAKTTND